ncbi:MAG: bifunctional phosphopantothenoylcysteine decarboxylase/phosphopantothenate--cysteine ligase CoaBC [Coriobacteriales bacterium]
MAMKTVLLGITGCIAAYKACYIVRGLQKAGVRVKVVMTKHATHFVGPTTFRALTNEEVAVGLFDEPGAPIHHISLAHEADLFCIAPATANVCSKIANGTADDLLTTTALATSAPLVIAPAMNDGMWASPVTQDNIAVLEARGARIVSPASGHLACGTEGKGRMEEPDVIVAAVLEELSRCSSLAGRRVLVTAGPTREPLDPVRFISNPSSGASGFALAAEAAARGAQVTLVTGPVALADPAGVEVVRVQTALEMLEACQEHYASCDAALFSAAVSDWRPAEYSPVKIKSGKEDGGMGEQCVRFVPNPDIAATLGAGKRPGQVQVVYAAETGNPLEAARGKLQRKNADLCVANDVSSGVGFGTRDNRVWLVSPQGEEELPLLSKRQLAAQILDRVAELLG